VRDATSVFFDQLTSIEPLALAAALAFGLLNSLMRTRAWRVILLAAYPETAIAWRTTLGAYLSGIAVNAVVPARGGDALRLYLVRRRVPGGSYPTLGATLVAETPVDMVVGTSLLVWALATGRMPGVPELPRLPTFELGWIVEHPVIAGAVAVVILVALVVAGRRLHAFWLRVRQGLAILRTPRRFLAHVVPYQLAGWACRVAGAYWFLRAFGLEPTVEHALLVQVAGSLATLMPATPGGLGPRQALLVFMLAGAGTRTEVLAFSVGMELALLVFNVAIGLVAAALMTGTLNVRGVLREARSGSRPPEPTGGGTPPVA
jgi:uncharacterized membrane protein YbhN (UPF0104 family)